MTANEKKKNKIEYQNTIHRLFDGMQGIIHWYIVAVMIVLKMHTASHRYLLCVAAESVRPTNQPNREKKRGRE